MRLKVLAVLVGLVGALATAVPVAAATVLPTVQVGGVDCAGNYAVTFSGSGTDRAYGITLDWSNGVGFEGATVQPGKTTVLGTFPDDLEPVAPGTTLTLSVAFTAPDGTRTAAGSYPLTRTCGYQALTPARILDTRAAGGAMGAGATRRLTVTGVGGVPAAGVGAVVVNLTGTQPTAGTYVTAYPAGSARPGTSNLNLAPGQTAPNLAVVRVGAGGALDLYNNGGSVHLVVDVVGWFPEGSDYTALTPARILDTRTTGAVPAGSSVDVQAVGRGGVPASGVGAVVVNLTGTEPTAGTYVTAYPTGSIPPLASNLNLAPGQTAPNLAVVKVGSGGRFSLFNNAGRTHVIADVVGWFPIGADFTGMTPTRLLDTRSSTGALAGGSTLDFQVTGRGGVPASGVGAVVVNLTGTEPTTGTYVTAYPTGATRPVASNLNLGRGEVRPNLAVVKVGAGGRITLFNNAGSVQLVADVVGWFPDRVQPRGYAWGANAAAQAGTGERCVTGPDCGSTSPTRSAVLAGATQVAAGSGSTYALASDGTVWAWGRNYNGQLGTGSTCAQPGCRVDTPTRVTGLTDVTQIAAGHSTAFALRADGTVWAWGYSGEGELGNGTLCPSTRDCRSALPVQVTGLSGIAQIVSGSTEDVSDAGRSTSFALTDEGEVWAWGDNGSVCKGCDATLGTGAQCVEWDPSACYAPVPVKIPDFTATTLSTRGAATLALREDGTVWAWGVEHPVTPRRYQGLGNIVDIALGPSNAYAISADGSLWAWGDNSSGALGNGTKCNVSSFIVQCFDTAPAKVRGLTDVTAVSTGGLFGWQTPGGGHTFATLSDGTVWAWGDNRQGRLGLGLTPADCITTYTLENACYVPTPTQVPGLARVTSTTAGLTTGYALTEHSFTTF